MPEPINLSEADGTPNAGQADLQAEVGRLRELVRTLAAERDQLREELKRVRSEADNYRNAIYALTRDQVRKEFTLTKAEIEEMETNGLSLEDLIEELERSPGD